MGAGASLVEPFLASAGVSLRPGLASIVDLEQRLLGMIEAAEAEWPGVAVPAERYVVYVSQRLSDDRSALEALDAVRFVDLYLACACADGHAAAIKTFDRRFIAEIEASLSRMRLSKASLEEVKQLVRQKLFVAQPGASPKITEYSGRSGLRRWVRSVAVRTCLNFMRKGKREVLVENDQVLAGVSSSEDDPEIAYMKEKYRNEFRDAFQGALDLITARQQSLLRYHYVDSLNIDEIGTIYRVHRVTAYRWLEKAREALIAKTNQLLRKRLNVEKKEFDSILRLIRSQLHVSLVRYLGDREPE